MENKHFLVVHTFINDVARQQSLTSPEKRNPPTKRKSEQEWAEKASQGKHSKLLQKWIGNDEFLFCHWVVKSKDDVYKQLEEDSLEGKFLNSIVHEANEFLSAFRNSEEILESFPKDGIYW